MERARRYLNQQGLGDTKLGTSVVAMMEDFAKRVDPRDGECEFKLSWRACKARVTMQNGCADCENFKQSFDNRM